MIAWLCHRWKRWCGEYVTAKLWDGGEDEMRKGWDFKAWEW